MRTRFSPWLRVAVSAFERAIATNVDNIASLIEPEAAAVLLDVGCDDGEFTLRFARAAGTTSLHGVELAEERATLARSRGVDVAAADLNRRLPYDDGAFGVVCGNQVIEHLTDSFVAELHRLVRPGGYAIISTENFASWHNVVALALGWQSFSRTNVTITRMGPGNPLAVHRHSDWEHGETWQHQRVFAHRGLGAVRGARLRRRVDPRGQVLPVAVPPGSDRRSARRVHHRQSTPAALASLP